MSTSNFERMKNFANPKAGFRSQSQSQSQSTNASNEKEQQRERGLPPKQSEQPKTEQRPANEQKTEEDDSQEELLKHPLQNQWSLWYFENDRSKSWEQNQNLVSTFGFVEEFWSLFNHIKQPSEIALGNDYSLFKKGIQPMWEDPANKQGGRWMIQLKNKADVDYMWLEIVLSMIGENYNNSDEICGVVVNMRSKIKISIWTANVSNEDAILEIGKNLKKILQLDRITLLYHSHSDSMVKVGSTVKAMYTL